MPMDNIEDKDVEPGDSSMPGTMDGMFVRQYLLDPVKRHFTTDDLIEIIRLLNLVVAPSIFDQLPEHTKKHFVVIDRKGERQRYGAPAPRPLPTRPSDR